MKNCQKLISIGFLTCFGILALFLPLTKVNAGNQMANFEVIPNFPANQNPKTGKGYFDLLVKPGQVQPLSITLVNNSDQAKKIRIMATDAKTTPTIDVSYDNSVKIKDDSLKFSFAKFGFTPKTVNLKAKSKLNVPLNFKVPVKPFKGIILGGIYIRELEAQDIQNASQGKTKLQLKNYLGYALAVQLTEDPKTLIDPDLTIKKINAISFNSYPATGVTIQNRAMSLGSNVSIKATTYLKRDRKIRATGKVNSGTIAPSSTFVFPLLFDVKNNIKPGEYHLDLKIKTATKKFNFSRDYMITEQTAAQVNRQNPSIKKSYFWLIVLAIVGGILLIGLIFLLCFHLGKNRGQQVKEKQLLKTVNDQSLHSATSNRQIPKRHR